MYGIIVVDLFNPLEDSSWLEQIMQIMPEVNVFFGFALDDVTNYQAFVAGYLYDMLFILLGIIFITMLVNRLVFRYLDQGFIRIFNCYPRILELKLCLRRQ